VDLGGGTSLGTLGGTNKDKGGKGGGKCICQLTLWGGMGGCPPNPFQGSEEGEGLGFVGLGQNLPSGGGGKKSKRGGGVWEELLD